MRYPYILCLLFIAALLVRPLPAQAEAGFVPSTFAWPLMQWVNAKMGTRVTSLPSIAVSRERMVALIGNPQRQAALARALYVPNQVVIDEAFWDPTNTRTVSFLVHELVHHAQLYNGRDYPCSNAKEWEAYNLQNLWLAERGMPPAVEQDWIATMATCEKEAVFQRTKK